MKSCYIKEQETYYYSNLLIKFGFDEKKNEDIEKCNKLIKGLSSKKIGILKVTDPNSGSFFKDEEEIDLDDNVSDFSKFKFSFHFVGIIIIEGIVMKCYPKYLNVNEEQEEQDDYKLKLLAYMKKIMKVLEKHKKKSKNYFYQIGEELGDSKFDIFSTTLFLLSDYNENGSYNKIEDTFEDNGQGEINWDYTIDSLDPFWINEEPYYVNVKTKKRETDEDNLIRKIHECIITDCSYELEKTQLSDIFGDIMPSFLSENKIKDFGDNEYILEIIRKELNIEFDSHKQAILKTMYNYIKQDKSLFADDSIKIYGTTSFNLVWETVCQNVFNNDLEDTLDKHVTDEKQLQELREKCYKYDTGKKGTFDEEKEKYNFYDLIEPARIEYHDGNYIMLGKNKIKPDIVCLPKNGEKYFLILDAKYYSIYDNTSDGINDKELVHIEDINKQFIYELAYSEFIKKNSLSVTNVFLFPNDLESVKIDGEYTLNMFTNIKLSKIKIVLLPAEKIYDLYLENRTINYDDIYTL